MGGVIARCEYVFDGVLISLFGMFCLFDLLVWWFG